MQWTLFLAGISYDHGTGFWRFHFINHLTSPHINPSTFSWRLQTTGNKRYWLHNCLLTGIITSYSITVLTPHYRHHSIVMVLLLYSCWWREVVTATCSCNYTMVTPEQWGHLLSGTADGTWVLLYSSRNGSGKWFRPNSFSIPSSGVRVDPLVPVPWRATPNGKLAVMGARIRTLGLDLKVLQQPVAIINCQFVL